MRNKILFSRWAEVVLITAAMLVAPDVALAAPVFDMPAKVITIPASGDQDAVTCTFYADVMVRISGTDTPAPDDAMLLRNPAAPAAAACAAKPLHGVELPSSGFDLSGRKGDFLIFEASDPTGASGLIVFDARSGRKLFADGESSIAAAEDIQGTLRLRYVRAINGACSLLADRDGCWAALLAGGEIPRGVFAGPPSRETCAIAYRQAASPAVPDDDPSMISYPVAVTLDGAGHASVRIMGPIGCDPMP
jgi:hypothetical protein